MGTDIHPAVEVRRKGVWRYQRPTTPCRWYYDAWTEDDAEKYNERLLKAKAADEGWALRAGLAVVGERKNRWDTCKVRLPDFFRDRNYRVFALLAGVRNGSGFAGVYTHDPIPVIQTDRGIPPDISKEARAKLSHEHTPGWVTLTELKAYDYRIKLREGGVLEEADYYAYLANNRKRPTTGWSGGVSGSMVVNLTEEEYLSTFESAIDLFQPLDEQKRVVQTFKSRDWGSTGKLFDWPDPTASKRVHIATSWEDELYEEVKTIPEEWVPYLEKLVPKGGTDDDVRVVFDFDS